MHKRQNFSGISVHHGKLNCHFCHVCTILFLVYNWSHTFFAGICAISEAGPVSSACPPPNVIWQNKSFGAHANNPAEGTSWAYELSCGGGNITALNSGCLRVRLWTQRRGCLSCFFCLLCILLSICSLLWCLACLSCSFLAFLFHFLSMDPPHLPLIFSYSLFDISFWVVVSLSLSLSLSLPLSLSPSLCLCLFDALIVGWMTEAIRLFHPHTYAELSCPVLRC